ncbi:MAG: hypothetical protein DCC67_14705 [Planctomycetota bacterium]|nr:MAG: hypothetical protein DCC67_14705 [Planctomycetota bacterium]
MLRCLVVSLSAERRRMIRSAAEVQAWEAIVCRDAGEFRRMAFRRSAPLAIVDLPAESTAEYWELRQATQSVQQGSARLLFVAGAAAEPGEEIWARSLGAWTYVNELGSQFGFEFVLGEAREAIARQATLLAPDQERGPTPA